MTESKIRWITFHRVRFAEPLNGKEVSFDGPAGASGWHFGTNSPIGENGLRTRIADVWGGAALYSDRAAAEAVIDAPADHLPFLAQARESWHGLLRPYAHRGELDWFDTGGGDLALETGDAAPDGPLAIITSAGYLQSSFGDLARITDFLENVERVRAWYDSLEANVVQSVFSFMPLTVDGITFTIWKSDKAMIQSAYGDGIHRTQLDRYHAEHTADRTSFTRLRLLKSSGSWDGRDLMAEAAA